MLIIFGLNMKFLISFIILAVHTGLVSADTKVDGFFPEETVRDGFFKNRPDIATKAETPKFFISREERRLHPDRAQSNKIVVPSNVVHVSSRPVILPNGTISDVWSVGVTSK